MKTWRDSWKVASWEMTRHMKNKSFIISVLLTPILFVAFGMLPQLFKDEEKTYTLHVVDRLNVYQAVEQAAELHDDSVHVKKYSGDVAKLQAAIAEDAAEGIVVLDARGLKDNRVDLYTGADLSYAQRMAVEHIVDSALQKHGLMAQGLSEKDAERALAPVILDELPLATAAEAPDDAASVAGGEGIAADNGTSSDASKEDAKSATVGNAGEHGIHEPDEADGFGDMIPSAVAMVFLFGIVMQGMGPFNSSMQEKKDKIAEMILSSVSATSLMQGKIIGHFVIGISQVVVWLIFGIPFVQMVFDINILPHLFVPEFALALFYALAGYLLFAGIFASFGATIDDLSTAGNFHSFVFLAPFVQFMLIAPVFSNPDGVVARVASYIPLTTPGVMVARIAASPELPVLDVVLTMLVLGVSIWFAMKAAGKIFRTGILLYGKNATPKEIWRWIRQ
ncbi:ABC transporter permease [Numidum massiliense]|uniref:ABC transporter permease n=1 Tax=Numidum massiliense TaxID=1522315 RepID=UPI0006D53154|nr:ABC transporter permease [Numidum massiliense]